MASKFPGVIQGVAVTPSGGASQGIVLICWNR
jgi:hypothetical protein